MLVYLDNSLIVGRGSEQVCAPTSVLVSVLHQAGAVISPRSKLELVQKLVWLGK